MRISVFVFSVMRDSYHAGGGKHHMGKLLQFLVTDATKENPIKAEYLSSISGSFFNLWLKRPLTAETRSDG